MHRKVLLTTLAVTLTVFAQVSFAGMINFTSGSDDKCRVARDGDGKFNDKCKLTTHEFGSWIDADTFNREAGSVGAQWVQAEGSYIYSDLNDYRVFELDLSRTGEEAVIESLFLSVDDDAVIKIGGKEIWNSNNISRPWEKTIDVIASLGKEIVVGPNQRLNFYVHDIGNRYQGPTGIIFAGTASVPEPSSLVLLGLGLAGLGLSRRKAAKA